MNTLLTQKELAARLGVSDSWIRKRGDRVVAKGETWKRIDLLGLGRMRVGYRRVLNIDNDETTNDV